MAETTTPPLPDHLFKYRQLGSEQDLGRIRDLIVGRRMWWPSPLEFNDPFDCAPAFRFPRGRKLGALMMRLEQKHNPKSTRRDRLALKKKAIRNGRYRYEEEFIATMRELMDASSVYSLSRQPNNILMWSHYASSHSGVCLRFDTNSLIEGFPLISQVRYSDERPEVMIGGDEDAESLFEKVMATKSDLWAYEEEYRLLAYREARGLRDVPEGCLNGIILGMKSTEQDRNALVQMTEGLAWPVAVYRAVQDARLFAVNLIPENEVAKREAG